VLPSRTLPITITIEHGPQTPIRLLEPHEAHWYLGVQFTMDGNHKTKLQPFQQCNQKYVNLLHQCPFPYCNVEVIYKQCYLPTMSYPLPAMMMPPAKLYKLQSLVTSVFLTKLGYPQTFP